MFYQVLEDEWKKKNKKVKFFPVILTKKKTNGNNEKGQLV